jgi:putative RecB family exonuclease
MESLNDLLECYNEAWVNDGFTSPQASQEFFEKGERMLVRYWDDNQDRKTEVLFVEKHFAFDLEGVKLRGIIDRIDRYPDGTVEVIDYKTHNEVWDQAKADADLQLSVYHMAAQNLLGSPPNLLSYYFVAHGQKVSTRRNEAQIAEALKIISKAREQILLKNFTPNTAVCHRCDFRQKCPHSIAKTPEPPEAPGTFSIKDILER